MVLTRDFVILNHPKTGSTFIRRMVQKAEKKRGNPLRRYESREWKWKVLNGLALFGIRLPYLELHHPRLWSKTGHVDQHGGASMVPEAYRHLPHGVGIRNPFELYISQYEFEWWKKNPQLSENTIHKEFPSFPNLNFRQFVRYSNMRANEFSQRAGVQVQNEVGVQTFDYVRTLFRKPSEVLRKLSESFITSGRYKKYLPNLKLIRKKSLNYDLYKFLSKNRYKKSEIEFVKEHEKINQSTDNGYEEIRKYYTKDLLDYVSKMERIIFLMFENLGIKCYKF